MAKSCNGRPTPLYSSSMAASECQQLSRQVDLEGMLREHSAKIVYAAVAVAGMNS
jgi:hypothetical protein